MKKLIAFRKDPKIKALNELCDIWGVGKQTALAFINKGILSVPELRTRIKKEPGLLTAQQLIGLNRYEELLVKIPRYVVHVCM